MNEKMVKFFDDMGGDQYDKGNRAFVPINSNLHFLNSLILKDLSKDARILCVGVGTGSEIIELAKTYKGWSFVGIEPAKSMLKKCEQKLLAESLNIRCELFHGFLADYVPDQKFDAVLCLFVMHFVKDMGERAQMYADMSSSLKENGTLIVTEISADFNSLDYKFQLENWQALHALAGATDEKLKLMPEVVEKQLAVIAPNETEGLIETSGFLKAIPFFQSFLIRGWYAKKRA